jgi:hypothetical protein
MTTRLAYAEARLSARYAALPGENEWQRLAAARTFASFVEEARVGPFQTWIKGVSALSDAHEIERALRALAWDLVDEAADWVPQGWRSAVHWWAWIPFLPLLAQGLAGKPLPAWAARDYRLRALLDAEGALDPLAVAQHGLGPLGHGRDRTAVATAWAQEWRRLWPRVSGAPGRHLESLVAEIAAHLAHFALLTPAETWSARRVLRERLRLRFHQRVLEPASLFVYLALVLLDLERLRGELLTRALFPEAA